MPFSISDLKPNEVEEIEKQLNERGTIVTLADLEVIKRSKIIYVC